MVENTPLVSQISQVMLQATAPAFLLGATGSFIGILTTRLNVIIERSRSIHAVKDEDPERAMLKSDIPRLKSRAKFLHRSIRLAVASSICTTLLIVWGFAAASLKFDHETGAAILFVVALLLFISSLIALAQEVRVSLIELDHLP